MPLLGGCQFLFHIFLLFQGHQFHPDIRENNNEFCLELLADVALFSILITQKLVLAIWGLCWYNSAKPGILVELHPFLQFCTIMFFGGVLAGKRTFHWSSFEMSTEKGSVIGEAIVQRVWEIVWQPVL